MLEKLIKLNKNYLNKNFDFKKMLCEQLWVAGNQNPKDRDKFIKRIILFFKILIKTIYNSFLRTPIIRFKNESKDSIFFLRKYCRKV